MKPAPFDYHLAHSLDEALALLEQYAPDVCVLAGGQSLIADLSSRRRRPGHVVDINRIAGLDAIALEEGGVSIGATASQAEVEDHALVRARCSYLPQVLSHVASAPIKHRGTVAGSLAHADPAAELPALALCVDARLTARNARDGSREIAPTDFFVGRFENTLGPHELLTGVTFPALERDERLAIEETQRRYNGVAVAGAIVRVTVADQAFSTVRAVVFGIAETPVLVDSSACLNTIAADDLRAIESASVAMLSGLTLISDVQASADYRRHAAAVLLARALTRAGAPRVAGR
jgi:carbon-monoxide dehydrogenase medium subunit